MKIIFYAFFMFAGDKNDSLTFPDGYEVLPKKRILNVQIKGKTVLDYPEKLDWKQIFLTLQKDGYQGKIGLETHIFGEERIPASHSSMQEILRIVQEL